MRRRNLFRGLWFRGVKHPGKPVIKRMGRRPLPFLSAMLGIGLALLVICSFERTMRPQMIEIAKAKANNQITQLISQTISDFLITDAVSYSDIVTLQTDEAGRISALFTNSSKMNSIQAALLETIVSNVNSLDSFDSGIPVGNLFGFTVSSGRGPEIPIRVLAVSSANASYRNAFAEAGINQTLHQVMLDISVTITLLLPGETVDVTVTAPVSIAETVIIGSVPDTYLQLSGLQ